MFRQSTPLANPKLTLFLKGATAILVIFYLVNCLTPLRIHEDMLRYYAIKDCIEFGCPPDSTAAQDYLPYGYTALLLILSKLGILKSFTIVFINCIYLFAGFYFVKKMFESSIHPFFFFTLTLLNWTIIKFVTHPLSEMQYLFFSLGSLYFFYQYTKTKKFRLLLPSFIFGGIAFLTRTVGVTLIAALVAGLLWEYRKEVISLIRKNKVLIAILVLLCIGVLVFSKQLGLNHYTGVMTKQFKEGRTIGGIILWHFEEWAEISLNLSVVKAAPYFPGSSGILIFRLAGILFFVLFAYLLFFRRNKIPFIVKAYLLFYSLLMFNWPFYDPRFWVPVLPLIVAVFVQAFPVKQKLLKAILVPYMAFYVLTGAAAVGYMTYTSLNKKVLARRQANGVYRNEYETHFFGKPLSDTATRIDPAVLNVLKRYD